MTTYRFRPYYAYDCDSEMGFNNGHYLDEIIVEATDEIAARTAALALLDDTFHFDVVDQDETATLDVDAAWTFDHIWLTESGEEFRSENELPIDPDTDEPVDAECYYLYKYLDLGEHEIVSE